jgi:FkbM family methyltransferase
VNRFYHWLLLKINEQSIRIPQTRRQRLGNRICNHLSRLVLRFNDPLLERDIAGSPLLVPFSHALPMYLLWHPLYSSNLGRLARYTQQKYGDLTIIDIGANIGDTIAILRREVKCPILCIEGEPQFFEILRQNARRFSDIEVVNAFLGDKEKEERGALVSSFGSAHMTNDSPADTAVRVHRLDMLLKEYPRFWNSKILKIDTDGYDATILRGAERQLVHAKPVLFFEYDPHFLGAQGERPLELLRNLQRLGYSRLMFYDNVGDLLIDTSCCNTRQLEEITLYFTGRGAQRYCDVCAFHRDDEDLCESIVAAELNFLRTLKGTI